MSRFQPFCLGWVPVLSAALVGFPWALVAQETWEPEVRRAIPVGSPSSTTGSDYQNPAWMDRVSPSPTPALESTPYRPNAPGVAPSPYRPGRVQVSPAPASTPREARAVPADPPIPRPASPAPALSPAKPTSTPPPVVSADTLPRAPRPPTPTAPAASIDEANAIRVAPTRGDDPAAEQLAKANSIYARKMYEFSAMEFASFLESYPEAAGRDIALFRLGESYRRLSKAIEARKAYEQLSKEFQKGEFYGAGCYRLGEALFAENDYRGALELFQASIANAREDEVRLSAQYQAARCLDKLERTAEAAEEFRAVVSVETNNPYREYARLALADSLARTDKKEEALGLFQEVAASATTGAMKAEATVKAAALAGELGRQDLSAKLFGEALRIESAGAWRPVAILGRIRLDAAAGRNKEVVQVAESDLKSLSVGQRAEALSLIASAYRGLGNSLKAREVYDRLLKEAPQSAQAANARFARIVTLAELGDASARREIEAFLKEPEGTVAQDQRDKATLLLAEIDFREEQFAAAAKSYEKAVASGLPENIRRQARNKLAWCLAHSGEPGRAIETYTEIIASTPTGDELPSLHLQRGLAAREAGQGDAALADFQKVIDEFPKSKERELALQHKAILLGERQDYAGMKAAFGELLAAFPKSRAAAQAEFWLGWADFENGKYDAALPRLNRARELDPVEYGERASLRIALCYYFQQNREALADEAVRLKTGTLPPDVVRWLGIRSAQDGDFVAAESHLASLVNGGNKDPETLVVLAESRNALGKSEDARTAATAALEVATEPSHKARAYLALADAHRVKKNFDDARAAVDEALRLQPEGRINAAGRVASAEIDFSRGNFDEAARAFMSISLLYDDPVITPRALQRAADAYRRAGKNDEADKTLSELKSRFPEKAGPRTATQL